MKTLFTQKDSRTFIISPNEYFSLSDIEKIDWDRSRPLKISQEIKITGGDETFAKADNKAGGWGLEWIGPGFIGYGCRKPSRNKPGGSLRNVYKHKKWGYSFNPYGYFRNLWMRFKRCGAPKIKPEHQIEPGKWFTHTQIISWNHPGKRDGKIHTVISTGGKSQASVWKNLRFDRKTDKVDPIPNLWLCIFANGTQTRRVSIKIRNVEVAEL